jgi:hypothetical protein
MVMFERFRSILAACACSWRAAAAAFVAFGLAVIEALAQPERFAYSGEGGPLGSRPFHPLDRALQNDLRHEANVSRRSAARHT